MGHDTPAVVAEAAAMAAPGRFLASAAVVKWDRSGVLRAAILAAERPHAPAAVPPGTRHPAAARPAHDVAHARQPRRRRGRRHRAAALSLLRPDVRAQVESAVWQRMATLYATVTSAGDAGYNRSAVTDRIRTAATWLREHYARPISIAQAAEAVGMSERSFLRHFRSETTVTPSDFLRDVRLDAVCRLLTHPSARGQDCAPLRHGQRREPVARVPPAVFADADGVARNPSRAKRNHYRRAGATGGHGDRLIMPVAWRFLFLKKPAN